MLSACEPWMKSLLEPEAPNYLKKMYFGCPFGVHIGWAVVDADNESAALDMLPSFLRNKAKAVKVSQYTPEMIKGFHEVINIT